MSFESPSDLLREHAADHPDDVVERALSLADADNQWDRGCAPKGVAAAALYAAYQEKRPRARPGDGRPTQGDVADEFGTNKMTLRQRYKALPAEGEA